MSEQYRVLTRNEIDPEDPCTCRRDKYPWPLCSFCRYEHDVQWAGGHTAYRLEKEQQQLIDQGLEFLC